jgi:hypothetical protein
LPEIFQTGLLAWDDEQREDVDHPWELDEIRTSNYQDSRLQPRRGRVYLGSRAYARRYDGIMLRVDLRLLDPAMLGCDEDHVDVSRRTVPDWLDGKLVDVPREWGSVSDWVDPPCPDCDGSGGANEDCEACEGTGRDEDADPREEESLGDWADGHETLIDSPEVVAYSLACGSVAVQGPLPVATLSVEDTLSDRDQEAIAHAFAAAGLTLPPLYLRYNETDLEITCAPDGSIIKTLPPVTLDWQLGAYAAAARGAQIVALLNA